MLEAVERNVFVGRKQFRTDCDAEELNLVLKADAAQMRAVLCKADAQRLVFDLRLEIGECDATVTDMVEDTVDYGSVCNVVSIFASR